MKKLNNYLLIALVLVTVVLLGAAVYTGGDSSVISANLIWGYTLLVAAVVLAVASAVVGMFTNPAGLKTTLVALVLIVVVIGGAVFYALGNLTPIRNSAGGVFDDKFELIITQTSIIVAYTAFAAAALVSLYSVIRNALK
ncbi:MAG: hypothetical protein KBT15_10910 [Bacteroidales bacterium]|nr:hypothetical protein [Candidatus Minthousia equi]